MSFLRLFLLVTLSFALSSCACRRLREGVVIAKRAHKSTAFDPMQTGPFFRLSQPDILWVDVEGKTSKGRVVRKHVAVFRADWSRIRVGDHWSAQGGFAGDCDCCKETKKPAAERAAHAHAPAR